MEEIKKESKEQLEVEKEGKGIEKQELMKHTPFCYKYHHQFFKLE